MIDIKPIGGTDIHISFFVKNYCVQYVINIDACACKSKTAK